MLKEFSACATSTLAVNLLSDIELQKGVNKAASDTATRWKKMDSS